VFIIFAKFPDFNVNIVDLGANTDLSQEYVTGLEKVYSIMLNIIFQPAFFAVY
jgi:hypothetical protein